MYRYIYRFAANSGRTEDILHDVFCELLAGKYQPGPFGTLKSWLYVVVKNKSLNYIKLKSREVGEEQAPDLIDERTDPESREIEKSNLELLVASINKLPRELHQTWELRRAGLDNQKISDELKIPLGTVKSRFFRIVDFLKKEMSDETK